MYYVYILISEKDGRTYTGYTNNFIERLSRHNRGGVKSTRSRLPLKKFHLEEFETKKEAKARELWWKSTTGRRKLRELYELRNS